MFFMGPEEYAAMKEKYPKFYEQWTEDEITKLKELYAQEKPLEEISQELQRTPKSIRMRLQSLGLYTPKPAPRGWTEDEDETLKAMFNDGVSFDDMAIQLGRSPRTIVTRLVHLRMNIFPSE